MDTQKLVINETPVEIQDDVIFIYLYFGNRKYQVYYERIINSEDNSPPKHGRAIELTSTDAADLKPVTQEEKEFIRELLAKKFSEEEDYFVRFE